MSRPIPSKATAPATSPRFSASGSLLQRVVLALAIVGLMPFGVTVYLISTSREAISDQAQATQMVATRAAAHQVTAVIELYRSLGQTIALHPDVSSDPSSDSAGLALQSFVLARGDILAAGLFQVSGEENTSTLIQLARRVEDRVFVEQALKAGDSAELVVTQTDDQLTFMRLRIPLDDPRLQILLVFNAEPIITYFVPLELLGESVLVLGDSAGNIVTGQLDSLDSFPPRILDAASKLQSGSDQFEIEGEEVICAYSTVTGTPWFVLSRQPMSNARSAVATMRKTAWRAFGSVVVMVALLAFAANTSIIKPIRRLAEAQRRLVGSGAPGAIGAGGEIAELESSFALLERHLNDREALSKVFLGRYQVIDVLGAGAMGTVFRGWDPRLQRYVALKTVKLDDADEDRRERLLGSLKKEAITLARLQHAHIVTVFDILEQGPVAFIAMELVEGVTLERYIWQRTALPADQVVPLGAAVFKALAAAHQQKFVHQDIKPGNVLLGRDGKIKVTDFGIADILSQAAKSKDVVVGTPGYLSPETLRGEGYTEKSDIFAAGVMLYESLTGKHPFPGTNVRQKIVSTLRTEVPRPSQLGFSVPPGLEMLILRLMSKDVDQRPEDAASAATAFEELASELGCRWTPLFNSDDRESDEDHDEDSALRRAHLADVATSRIIE